MTRVLALALGAAAAAAATHASAQEQGLARFHLRGGMYAFSSPAGNSVVQVGRDGVLVVDPGAANYGPALVAEIRRLSSLPIRWVVNTNADPDHIASNVAVAGAGENISGGGRRPDVVYGEGGAPIWAHEGALQRLSGGGGEPVGWPTDTYFVAAKDMYVNGEAVQLLHAPAAHTGGDSLVMFRRSDVIAAGDVYTPDRFPVIDLANGGSIDGLIDALNQILRLTVPEFNQEGGTIVVPGHGRVSDEADVAEYRDMVTIVRDRVREMAGKRMTLAQIQAAKPTFDYDPSYGGEAAGRQFVEAVYRSLAAPRRTASR